MDSQLEIRIKKVDDKFKATCQLFPDCKGFGLSEDEAIKKLTESIGRFLGKVTSKMMSEVISNEDYTEIIEKDSLESSLEDLDSIESEEQVDTTETDVVKRVYSMGNMFGFNINDNKDDLEDEKSSMFKLLKKGEHSPIMLTKQNLLETARVNDFDSVLGDIFNQEGYVFGFPINFN